MSNMSILWHSCSPTIASGYGVVTKNVALRLGQVYPLTISTYYGLHPGGSLRLNGVRVLPTSEGNYGEYSVKHYIEKFKVTHPILHTDFWAFKWFSELTNSIFYGPIDSYDYTPEDITVMDNFTHFIPCSQFGADVYKKLTGKEPTTMIPHGVDTSLFKPYNKEECKQLFNLQDTPFVFGIVAANSDPELRKGWDDLFIALSEFKTKFPSEQDKWKCFAYTKPFHPQGGNLVQMVKHLELEDNVVFPEHLPQMIGLPDAEMAKLYNCFDVLVAPSKREGFGIPILESQSCGVPVIASDSSALHELVTGHGWLVKKGERTFSPRGWECYKVDRTDLTSKLEEAYFDKQLRLHYGKLSRIFSLSFDWNLLMQNQWIPLIENFNSNLNNSTKVKEI